MADATGAGDPCCIAAWALAGFARITSKDLGSKTAAAGRDSLRPLRIASTCAVRFRISASDWAEGGWTLEESVELSKRLKQLGVDLIDCSSGGLVAHAKVEIGPGYQVPFARRIRKDAGVATGAVGLITEPAQAEEIIASGDADAVLLARELLRDPYWPLHAAKTLGVDVPWPKQYERAKR